MIREYRYGTPFETEALVEKAEAATGAFPYGTDYLLLIPWARMTLYMGWERPTGASTKEDTVTSAGVAMIRNIPKTNALCTVPTILLFSAESRRLDCFLIIREN